MTSNNREFSTDFKCIIFDCDGVLVDSESLSSELLLEMSRECGFEVSADPMMEQFHGVSLHTCLQFIENANDGKKLPENFEREFRRRSFEVFRQRLQPVRGIQELLPKISKPFCVASSGPREKIELNLSITGLFKFFKDKIFSSYDIGSWKPDPGIFLHAAESMGFHPSDCVVVEDSRAGIEAAIRGGFQVWHFAGAISTLPAICSDANVSGRVVTFQQMNELEILI